MSDRQRMVDIGVGLFMVLGLLSLLTLVVKVSGLSHLVSQKGYKVTAAFTDIGGLKVRAPVTVAGVKVGEVSDIALKSNDLNATVTLTLQSDKLIPFEDISARILTEGLLGSNYISIVPGFENEESHHPYLKEGDVISKTQQAVILENLIGQLLFNIKK